MRCDALLSALNDYLDGDTRDVLCQAIRQHLAGCPACRVVIDNLRQTITLYRAGEAVSMPEGLHQRIREVLRRRWIEQMHGRVGA